MPNVDYLTDQDILHHTKDGRSYPDPFFDLANNYIPKDIKKLFKYCRNFFYTNSFLRNVVSKLTEYPITDILYESDADESTRKKYDTILNKDLKIKSFLISIGLDYYTYGNAFISSFMRPKRFVKFPSEPDQLYPIEKIEYKLKKWKLHAVHPNKRGSGMEEEIEIVDKHFNNAQNFKLVRWNPENIDIDYNPITGTTKYYYKIPNKVKKKIVSGDRDTINEIPLVFLNALKEKKSIQLDSKNLYHFKRPTLAEDNMAWGKPLITAALKDIFYLQTLKRGNEAIAMEHITPKKAISPASTGAVDPFSQMNLGKWNTKIQEQIKKWRQDPNHIGVFPIPMAYQELGGNARALLLTNEMKFLEETIINSLGVPLEFIKGGASWTGSSISLRIIENHFLTYRELLEDFLNHFLIDKLSKSLDIKAVKVRFKKFKMSDDAQAKQLVLNLAAEGKISDERLLDEFGYNYREEQKAIEKARAKDFDIKLKQSKAQAEAQGQAEIVLQKYQTRARVHASIEELKVRTEIFQEELTEELGGIPYEPFKYIEHNAMKIAYMDPVSQEKLLSKFEKESPITHSLIIERLQAMINQNAGRPATGQETSLKQEEAPNKQPAGTREKDKIDTTKEKTTAAKRGTPG